MTATEEAPSGPAPPSISVWAPEHRRLTTGLVLTITLVAFESLAISTVMPDVRDDLGQLDLYGWVFSAFFLGTLVGAVMAGRAADRRGTAAPFVLGLTLFAVGITIGGATPSMLVLVLARVLQGLGAGAIPAVAYTSVGRAYPSSVQPRVFAVFSTAWVIPGMAGPAAASAISHALDWRFVFWAIVPLIAVALVMTLPALRRPTPGRPPPPVPTSTATGSAGRWCSPSGAGLVLAATTATSAPIAIGLAVVGIPVAARAFLALVPEGTTRLRPGLPAAIAIRGMVTFAFFGTDSFVPLGLTDARGQSTFVAGLALTTAVLGWTTAAWVQQHRMHRDGPRRLVATGQAIGAVGILGAALLLHDPVPVPWASPSGASPASAWDCRTRRSRSPCSTPPSRDPRAGRRRRCSSATPSASPSAPASPAPSSASASRTGGPCPAPSPSPSAAARPWRSRRPSAPAGCRRGWSTGGEAGGGAAGAGRRRRLPPDPARALRVDEVEPAGRAGRPWPDEASARLARDACYDCHSNETEWPAYSYVAPMSWLVRRDVDDGRHELNFSDWGDDAGEADDAVESLREGSMPPSQYELMHPAARLTDDEVDRLVAALEAMDAAEDD